MTSPLAARVVVAPPRKETQPPVFRFPRLPIKTNRVNDVMKRSPRDAAPSPRHPMAHVPPSSSLGALTARSGAPSGMSSRATNATSRSKVLSSVLPLPPLTSRHGQAQYPPPAFETDYDCLEATSTETAVIVRAEMDGIKRFERSQGLLDAEDGGGGAVAAVRVIPSSSSATFHNSVATVDEEASARMLKVMFQLNVTRNSPVMLRLRQLDQNALERRITNDVGHKRQLSRDEFCVLLGKLLRDDFLNRRDCVTLFSIFDDDKSGVVDAAEFVSGFMSLITSGTHDIAYKFIATVLEGREKGTVNAFISRFELQMLIQAAQQHFHDDEEVVRLLEEFPNRFSFSHHLGRIPVVQLRDAILGDADLNAIFSALPNPHGSARSAVEAAIKQQGSPEFMRQQQKQQFTSTVEKLDLSSPMFVADQFMITSNNASSSQQQDGSCGSARGMDVPEHDEPKWWTSNNVVYRSTKYQPDPQPVFLKEK